MAQHQPLVLDDSRQPIQVTQVILRRVHIVVAHNELLVAVQLRGDLEIPSAEAEVVRVPDGIFRDDDGVPSADQLSVVLLDGGERAEGLRLAEFDNAAMPRMRVGDETFRS